MDAITKYLTPGSPQASTPASTPASTLKEDDQKLNASTSTGGRRKRKGSRRYRGGFADNISFSNVANNAAPYSGGKSRRRSRKGRKSRKSRKGRRKH